MATKKRTGFEGGLWVIPLGLFLAMAWSIYRGVRSAHSGSTIQNPDGSITDSVINVHYWQTGGGVFSFILAAALIISIILMRRDR